jgi:hypothetical protein
MKMNSTILDLRARIVPLLVLTALLAACGYSTSSRTAKGIKSIAVPFFENQTAEPALEITVTESIIQNLVEDNTLKVTGEDYADAILRGQIVEFQNRPFSFDADLNAEEYRVDIKVRATLTNRELGEPIWENLTFGGHGNYFLDTVVDEENTEENTFEDAVDLAIKMITDEILNKTTQDW